ncbi:hypothetical protein MCOR25_007139 [Pyricularia grisea]|nr:hypothetical protein MCOR25_007139 [Pyricularia grisea]
MPTTVKISNNINQRVTDTSKDARIPAAASSLEQPALSRATAASNTMTLAQASTHAVVRSNSGSETNVDILPQHIGRGPHGSFEWDHGISPQRGPYKDDPHGHVNGYFGSPEGVGNGAAENRRVSVTSKPVGCLKNGTSLVHIPLQQTPAKTSQQNALSKNHTDVFCGCGESSASSNHCGLAGAALKAGKESQEA